MDTKKHTETAVSTDLRLSAAAALQRHEIRTASLGVEECARRIDRHDWTVKHDSVNDVWTVVADRLTAKGVTAFLAERDFLESLLEESELDPALVA